MSHELRLERTFDARPEVVFDVFIDPDAQRALFADGPDWIVESELDLRVGGTWTLVFGPSRSQLYREVAVFSEVDRPHRLAYAVMATFHDGRTFDTEMEITFEEKDGQTTMTLTQTGYPSGAIRDDYTAGWTDLLDRLAPLVAERAAGRTSRDAYNIPHGHDGWVVGDEAFHSVEFGSPAHNAKT